MPRNTEKDMIEESRRRERILAAGLQLFSTHGIENVAMNTVAKAADVGPTTLFKYYQTKERLVIAISAAAWSKVWRESVAQIGAEDFSRLSAFEMIRRYTDCIIAIYQHQPALLRFSGDYKTFICRQQAQPEELQEHLEPLRAIQAMFHTAFMRAQVDHSIRTDIPEDVLFTAVAIGMLATAERYAQGIVWAGGERPEHLRELRATQEMILLWCAAKRS
ncbi:MAG: TetR/AcrR family transcriptional regulator [Clostridiales bacterium]|nr:TetR/AcrR family transcriptional regulator [Clostridiales bacterium]